MHTGSCWAYFCSAVESGARDGAHQRVDGPQATELAPEGGGPGRVFISGWTKESSEGVLALFLMLEGMARWWPVVGGRVLGR